MVETLLYYFIKYKENKVDLTCKHEHHSLKAAVACLEHYRLYYPRAKLIKKIEVKEWRDEPVRVPSKSSPLSPNDQSFRDAQYKEYQENETEWDEKARADIMRRRQKKNE